MKKEYDTFIQSVDDFVSGLEYALTIRDLTLGPHKYESRYVRAVVYDSPQGDGCDVLQLRFLMGLPYPKPWGIKITEELGEYEPIKACER